MRSNYVKEKLKRGEVSWGAWLAFPTVPSARLMARLGFDWLLIDMEHSAHNPTLMADIIATIADSGACAPFVRIPSNSVEWVKWALDAGAWGIMVPMINTPEEAMLTVAWSKYPPLGHRSIGGRFAAYAFNTDTSQYRRVANDETMVIIQIESTMALQNLDAILTVAGLDMAFVGPFDLHAQLGLQPAFDSAEPGFVHAIEQIIASAGEHHIPLGIMCGDSHGALKRAEQGFQFVSVTTDVDCIITEATCQLQHVVEGSHR